MKKFIASAGLVTVGAVTLQAAYAPGLTPMETSKPWSVAATLRGFYDDNYLNAPSGQKKSSGGFEFSPSGRLNLPMEQTFVGISALYSMKYYFDRKNNNVDHLLELDAKVDHRFSERYKGSFSDSFVYTVDPQLVDPTAQTTFQRQNSDAIRNTAMLSFDAQITELLGMGVSYQNTYYKYLKNDQLETELDRFEHLFDVHGTWQIREHLTGLFGYTYGIYDYTSDKLLNPVLGPFDPISNPGGSFRGTDRDDTSHYFYVGAEHAFSSQLNGTIKVGAEYTSYDNHAIGGASWNPYADVRGTYTYLPGSFVQVGLTHQRNATDVIGSGTAADIVKDQESTTLFASVNHRITPRVTGNLLGQFQRSSYSGGVFDGKIDYYLTASVNLEYRINNNWAADIGYSFDRLDSDLGGRSFSRNRVYGGVRANF